MQRTVVRWQSAVLDAEYQHARTTGNQWRVVLALWRRGVVIDWR
jgi:hypothetical protein